ncbi:tRNA dimethylallyltransferase 9-like [Eucalyptus grandis]|uniref:tRNA dimethylallyltransferase 9-like n=1 Tax=Eucalyptus grandis TaxID=71139 RepID=UPI00192E88A5|nr:tRNA dimethylallyltransferase 9-like [Eucalyptus grandis]
MTVYAKASSLPSLSPFPPFHCNRARANTTPAMFGGGAACGLRNCCLRPLRSPIEPLLRRSTRSRCLPAGGPPPPRGGGLLRLECGAKQKVIVISGPTGAGKSRLALELAKRLNGEIISADSVQVYRGLDVGSAKPSLRDRKEVQHHLVDILHPSEDYSVGQFFEDARQATKDIIDGGRVPIVSGGTGLYLRWYMYGKPDVPKASPEISSEVYSELADLQKNGDWNAAVQLVVKAGDPKAQHLAANDWYRLRRSLEIIKVMTEFWRKLDGFSMRVFSQIPTLQLGAIGYRDKNFCKKADDGVRNEHIYHWLDASKHWKRFSIAFVMHTMTKLENSMYPRH